MAEKKLTDYTLEELVRERKEFSGIIELADLGACIRARDAVVILDKAAALCETARKELEECSELVRVWYEKTGVRFGAEDLLLRVSGALLELKGNNKKGKPRGNRSDYIDKALSCGLEAAKAELDAVIEAKSTGKER